MPHDSDSDSDPDDDPIIAEYDVYITSPFPSSTSTSKPTTKPTPNNPEPSQSLYLLQFPTRDRETPYNAQSGTCPTSVRLKPSSGYLELDVPINPTFNYDRTRAKEWGSALHKASTEGAQGFGLAAGFAQNVAVRSGGAPTRGATAGSSVNSDSRASSRRPGPGHFNANEEEEERTKLIHQTLGGQIIREEKGRPQYMLGAFRANELHLTPLTGLVQLRPQFHHLDATTQVERNSVRRANHADAPPRTLEPRLVQMSAKAGGDPESAEAASGQTTKAYLASAQEETWIKLGYTDEDEEEAFTLYHEMLFLGEDKEEARRTQLKASMSGDAWLDAISAPRLDPGQGKKILRPMRRRGGKLAGDDVGDDGEIEEVGDVEGSPLKLKKVDSPVVKREKGKGKATATLDEQSAADVVVDVSMADV